MDTVMTSHELAKNARRKILTSTHSARVSHVGSALSVVDILAVLYAKVANISPGTVSAVDRDRVIFSKGHAAAALYSILELTGFVSPGSMNDFCSNGSNFGGHVTHTGKTGVELSTGSLGHGLPYGLGIALGLKQTELSAKVFVIISDGECNEGTTWESALIANQFQLENLVVIIDRNRIQSLGHTEKIMKLEPLGEKWQKFGWQVREIDGHSHNEIEDAFQSQTGPLCVIANTVKGKGVSFMENQVSWHYKSLNDSELALALGEN
jgi:transketolase